MFRDNIQTHDLFKTYCEENHFHPFEQLLEHDDTNRQLQSDVCTVLEQVTRQLNPDLKMSDLPVVRNLHSSSDYNTVICQMRTKRNPNAIVQIQMNIDLIKSGVYPYPENLLLLNNKKVIYPEGNDYFVGGIPTENDFTYYKCSLLSLE